MAALLLLAGVAVRAAWGMYGKFASAAAADAAAQNELAALAARHAQVGAMVAELSTDRGVESQVRQRYGVGRPGEGEIDIVRQPSTTSDESAGGRGFWRRLWDALFVW